MIPNQFAQSWMGLLFKINTLIASLETVTCLLPNSTTSLTLSSVKKTYIKAFLNKAASSSEKHKCSKTPTMYWVF